MSIRTIKPNEFEKVGILVKEAFLEENPQADEDQLIARLRDEITYEEDFEVVYEQNKAVVGHGMLSDIVIGDETGFLALAPLAVKKSERNQGYGADLIKTLEERAIENGYRAISILGDPAYYNRFGYVPAEKYHVTTTLDVPDDYYLIKELVPNGLKDVSGEVRYLDSFGLN
ncbi:N-acetyltransferase [Vagococcus coleopterorum]|uniref:N-acetyltransferase n=1 Tax=Vagococcus coleopterorum TaxID=2714946 RepID=A0A6G8ANP2_9ENTE|nr:N-acetyltransferase [Vagococcus coleopterorum]QIL46590.1 N-acetyltransferase [Vagococcus coleopterorum]